MFVTALLTIIGFSVHDTIVVFDRIRENLARQVDPSFEEVVNYSLAQTIVRSVNTSLTVVFTLLALYLFGGESTRTFVLALLIGIISGTYSSIFNASQLLVRGRWKHFRRWWNKVRRRERNSPCCFLIDWGNGTRRRCLIRSSGKALRVSRTAKMLESRVARGGSWLSTRLRVRND